MSPVVPMGSSLLWTWCLVASAATLLWGVSLRRRDAGVVDVFWGPAFVGATLVARWRAGFAAASAWQWGHLAMVAAWGVRLAVHIAVRGRGRGEDRRYANMRQAAGGAFWWISLFKVFLLQATLVALLAPPLAAVQLRPTVRPAWFVAGLALWAVGLLCELTADRQLLAFQRDPASRGQVLATGLWRFSRHPNYFGEALLWWGYGACAAGVVGSGGSGWGVGCGGAVWTLYAPLAMTVLLLRVSGVPLLEAGMAERRPGYRTYVARTSSFVPWPPRRAAEASS
jgi:steroid 5-alpha reductase family enzyme